MRPTKAERTVLYHQCLPALDGVTPDLVDAVCTALSGTPAEMLEGDVRIVLTEAVNNIVEHAYAGPGFGALIIRVTCTGHALWIDLIDWGHPYTPTCDSVAPPDPLALNEGGYGSFLIRALVSALRRSRQDGKNRLTLRFDLQNPCLA